jgi:hypothetical protein
MNISKLPFWKEKWNCTTLARNRFVPAFGIESSNSICLLRTNTQIFIVITTTTSSSSSQLILSPTSAFWAGALSKALAKLVTYRLQLTQTILRMQKYKDQSSSNNNDKYDGDCSENNQQQQVYYEGTLDCLQKLHQRQGYQGLNTGFDAKLLQRTVLTAAFTFLTYGQILRAVHAVLEARQQRTTTTT